MSDGLAIIGFGEAGAAFAGAARWHGGARAFDIRPERRAAMIDAGIVPADSVEQALGEASIVLSLVTADQALVAARQCARHLRADAIWCDMNSIAPQAKRDAAGVIEAGGAHYVDVAVLAPVHPALLGVPLLLSGARAAQAGALLGALGFAGVRVVGPDVGRAAAIKMIRSVMIKGIEALTDEMMAAAEAAGVVDDVLASLDASERHDSWRVRAAYNRERMATHGARRAAEMEEAARTLAGLGVDPVMTEGTVRRQRAAARDLRTRKDAA